MAGTVGAQAPQLPLPATIRKPHEQTTFQMRGDEMPVGLLEGGRLERGFALRPFTAAIEKSLAKKRKKREGGQQQAAVVVDVLMELLTQLGPHDFTTLSDAAKQLLIGRLFMCDALYIYFRARIDALGDELAVQIKCPACNHQWKFRGDLSMCDVKVAADADSVCWEHQFKHGLPLRDGTRAMSAILQPPLWSALTGSKGKDIASVKLLMIMSSIRQLGGGKELPTLSMFEEMTKWDIEHTARSLDDNAPGPDLTLEPVCPECEREIKIPISWDFDFFYNSASL